MVKVVLDFDIPSHISLMVCVSVVFSQRHSVSETDILRDIQSRFHKYYIEKSSSKNSQLISD